MPHRCPIDAAPCEVVAGIEPALYRELVAAALQEGLAGDELREAVETQGSSTT